MLTITFNRSDRKYEVEAPNGCIHQFPCGIEGKQDAFQTAVRLQDPALYETAVQMAEDTPAMAARIWRACEIVLSAGVNYDVTCALALVASQSSAYGSYVVQRVDGLMTCDCEDFVGGTAVYRASDEQPYCKHILAATLGMIAQPV